MLGLLHVSVIETTSRGLNDQMSGVEILQIFSVENQPSFLQFQKKTPPDFLA